jgi:hypothetical protein
VTASLLALVVACSSTSTGTAGPGGSTGTGGNSNGLRICSGAGAASCTAEDLQPYDACIADKCSAKFAECYGPSYKSGTFAGPCGPYITCTNACACDDDACRSKCGSPDAMCTSCITAIGGPGSCSSACTPPACAGGSSGTSGTSGTSGGDSGEHSCVQLKACCERLADAAKKAECNQSYEGVKSFESSCSYIYNTYEPDCGP